MTLVLLLPAVENTTFLFNICEDPVLDGKLKV
jgi:hypothetical protein